MPNPFTGITITGKLFPETKAQATALMAFGTAAAISNIVGLLIGGAVASAGNWRWCMWLIGIVSLPVALLAAILIPGGLSSKTNSRQSVRATVASLDLVGSSLVAIFLILFVYGLTEGNISGWKSAKVIIPIVTSFSIILPFFFIYEEFGRTRRGLEAALPNAAWKLPNFAILFIMSLSSFFYYGDLFITYSALWGEGYHWSPMKQAQHLVPAGLATLIAAGIAPPIINAVGLRYFLSGSMVLYAAGGVLLAHALDPAQYWQRAVPGMSCSAIGAGATYLACSQSLVQCGPQSMSGVLGATFNSALQIGYVIAIAISLALIQNVGVRKTKNLLLTAWLTD